MDTQTRAFLEAMEERIVGSVRDQVRSDTEAVREEIGAVHAAVGTLRAEMREGFDSVDRRFGAVDKRFDGIERQVESLARATATEFERAHTSLAEITENTARSFAGVEHRMQQIEA